MEDAPSRGHDLKLLVAKQRLFIREDAPSRGHDLKPPGPPLDPGRYGDAPSRGHDLKHIPSADVAPVVRMPPHGGMT